MTFKDLEKNPNNGCGSEFFIDGAKLMKITNVVADNNLQLRFNCVRISGIGKGVPVFVPDSKVIEIQTSKLLEK